VKGEKKITPGKPAPVKTGTELLAITMLQGTIEGIQNFCICGFNQPWIKNIRKELHLSQTCTISLQFE
jgi:hypothetical protein